MGLDEYKQMTPTHGGYINTTLEKCNDCGREIIWSHKVDCEVIAWITIKETNTKFKVTQYRCKNCQK